MKLARRIFLACSLFASAAVLAQDLSQPERQAQMAAQQWLALADAGQFASTWDQAASPFQAAISKPNWESSMKAVRAPLGSVKTRTLKSAEFTKSLPGAPDGEYVVVRFETQFEHKPSAIETVTPMKGQDGLWRVSGYFIK